MSEAHEHEMGGNVAVAEEQKPGAMTAGKSPFSDPETEAMHNADWQAAAALAGLMASIFTIGLILYLVICFIVAGS